MPQKKPNRPDYSNNQIRSMMLDYFYERNRNATSAKGKKGSAVKISDIKSELKSKHDLTQQEIQSNLTYLISQGWIDPIEDKKEVRAPRGTLIPSTTVYYQITAAGIDKKEGPGEFTMPKYHDIKIEATGQNIITLGDGNQIDAKFGDLGEALSDLRKAITQSEADESVKLAHVADIDTIQSQLAKPTPNNGIIAAAWDTVKAASAINGCSALVIKVAALIAPFIGM